MPRKRLTPYPNRSDIAAQPVSVPTGGAYGSSKQSSDAQKIIPLPQTKPPTSAPPAVDPMESAVGAAQGMEFRPVGFDGPTTRPNEPITAGLPVGPGPGPEVLTNPRPRARAADTFRVLATATGDPEFERLAMDADAGGI